MNQSYENGQSAHLEQQGVKIGRVINPKKFRNQDFDSLREINLKKKVLFEDETFPANMNSIGPKLEKEFKSSKIEWKRPKPSEYPRLVVDSISLFDIKQSKLGDCWVLSVLGALTYKEHLLKIILPLNQEFDQYYSGIFHFRFWSFGDWWDVVVDDRLPYLDGEHLSARPSTENELWPCLLEKAYAKLLGSYQNLHFGAPANAFTNFTGGLAMSFELKSDIELSDLFHMIKYATPETVMTCTTKKKDGSERNRSNSYPTLYKHQSIRRGSAPVTAIPESVHLGNGLVESHAYSIVGTAQVHFRNQLVNLIQIWNPWGYGEWMGPWNDMCPFWKEVTEAERQSLLKTREDGMFYMSFEDFVAHFFILVICSPSPDYLDWDYQPKQWYRQMFMDTWPKGIVNKNDVGQDLIFKNPQYLIQINDSDTVVKGFNVVISLMQHPANQKKFYGVWPSVAYQIIPVDSKFYNSKEKLQSSQIHNKFLSGLDNPSYNKRDLTSKFRLKPGTYLIYPYVENTEVEFSFLLQIFLKSKDCAIQLGTQQSSEVYNSRPLQANYLTVDDQQLFRKYASQESRMNVHDLQRFLNEVILKDFPCQVVFTKDSTRLILRSMDHSGAGSLAADQFSRLWRYLERFKEIFFDIDTNQCGSLNSYELRKAVEIAGRQVSRDELNHLILLFGDSENNIHFVEYLVCMLRLKAVAGLFKCFSTDGKGVYLSYEQLMKSMI
ncbi:calpain-13-like isoform X1 [Pelobates cultripes]|uniref:Calpain-13-like isoform X1 n=1 Tax=Pelobates cultripes TaxID=61616 RepID=A0AAD1RI32_PELCU|nr:calpain-13-like isoform X1 [Pelobates cultripes]